MPKRILVIANKWFEVDPLIGLLGNAEGRGSAVRNFRVVAWPTEAGEAPQAKPRVTLTVGDGAVEVWCIQDLMDPKAEGGYSSTQEKARVMPQILAYGPAPSLMVAFGTAATAPEDGLCNGCVSIGSRVFVFNPYAQDPGKSPSRWSDPSRMGKVVPSTIPVEFFAGLSRFDSPLRDIHARFLTPLGFPAPDRVVFADHRGVAVSSVNVVDAKQYPVTDPAALAAARAAGATPIMSYESTHGVIRFLSEAPFVFVSGLTNRVGRFAEENMAFPYSQNFVAGHNAGLAVTWLLPLLVKSV